MPDFFRYTPTAIFSAGAADRSINWHTFVPLELSIRSTSDRCRSMVSTICSVALGLVAANARRVVVVADGRTTGAEAAERGVT
jgi:hypothetical protein